MKTILHSIRQGTFMFLMLLLVGFAKGNAQCSTEVLTLLTQADVDNFGTTYPSVTDWDGSIKIGDYTNPTNITNLAGFSNLESICGSLTISFNPLLPNLNGLENLTHLGNLTILVNPLLTNLAGLNNLNSVEDVMSIDSNHAIANLQGLGNLNSVKKLYISNNGFINLNGLGALNITNTLSIYESPALQSLSGLNLLNSHLENLYINYNPELTNIDALQTITTAGEIHLGYNNSLTSVNGLSNLTSADYLAIYDSENITNVDGLQNLTSVGVFTLQEINIANINGLVNVVSMDELFLLGCYQLENLSGLENLLTLKRVNIDSSPLLNSIDALSNVTFLDYDETVDPYPPYIFIYENSLLSQCAIAPICDKITDSTFEFYIEGNALGCESVEALEEACENLGVAEIGLITIKLYPNLASDIVNITGGNFSQVKIFDMMGKRVLDAKIENNSFNVEKLSSGRYVAQLIGGNGEEVVQDLFVK